MDILKTGLKSLGFIEYKNYKNDNIELWYIYNVKSEFRPQRFLSVKLLKQEVLGKNLEVAIYDIEQDKEPSLIMIYDTFLYKYMQFQVLALQMLLKDLMLSFADLNINKARFDYA